MSDHPRHPESGASHGAGKNPPDDLDALLREWHHHNAARAAAGRETLLARLRADADAPVDHSFKLELPPLIDEEMEEQLDAPLRHEKDARRASFFRRRWTMHRTWSAAAAALAIAVALPLLLINRHGNTPTTSAPGDPLRMESADAARDASSSAGMAFQRVAYEQYVLAPEGGRLDAFDNEGGLVGPFVLKHTDVTVDASGFLTRVTVTQKYSNPHPDKIEAIYTFPLSERAAVDRMTMTIGNRVIDGEVKEREEARRIYEHAKASNRIASLLEQERPNVFTQSIANIEPGADVDITISYVETTRQNAGVFEFDFPTTVAPRYVPGDSASNAERVPEARRSEIVTRHGVVLVAPAKVSEIAPGDTSVRGPITETSLLEMLVRAVPIRRTSPTASPWCMFHVTYPDGSGEAGVLYTDGVGHVDDRWFFVPDQDLALAVGRLATVTPVAPGAPFSGNTTSVPDASKVTPMPVIPSTPRNRAGHDISITVNIDTGGPALGMVSSELHEVVTNKLGSRATIKLKNDADLPNRDFVLRWAQESPQVEPAVFVSAGQHGNFFAVQMNPPPVNGGDDAIALPREITFVLDVSGSMKGRPIEKAKEVLDKALASLRPIDRFNIIKFSTSRERLWLRPRPADEQSVTEAKKFYAADPGDGGTEIVNAVNDAFKLADSFDVRLTEPDRRPNRFIVFLTDGLVSNENEVLALIQSVKTNGPNIAVFPFAIGDSINRYLLESMARYGRGEVEYVYSTTNADEVIARFNQRIRTPILTDIKIEFSPNLHVVDVLTALGGGGGSVSTIDAIPDLFDAKPLTIVGRYTAPAQGAVTITGNSASGPYRRIVNLDLPAPAAPAHRDNDASSRHQAAADTIATLWARAKVESIVAQDLRGVLAQNIQPALKSQIITLGESFNLITPYTSFVAVDRLRVTIAGRPRLVHVPIELPADADVEGFFGLPPRNDDELALLGMSVRQLLAAQLEDALNQASYDVHDLQITPNDPAAAKDTLSTGAAAAPDVALNTSLPPASAASPPRPAATPAPGAPSTPLPPPTRSSTPTPAPESLNAAPREPAARPRKQEVPAETPTNQPAEGRYQYRYLLKESLAEQEVQSLTRGDSHRRASSSLHSEQPEVGVSIPTEKARAYEHSSRFASQQQTTYFGVILAAEDENAADRVKVQPNTAAETKQILDLYFRISEQGINTTGANGNALKKVRGETAQRVVLAEHVVIRIAELAKENQLDQAVSLAHALVAAVPDVPSYAELRRVLTDASVTADERARVIAEQETAAAARLAAVIREGKLRQRLDPSLFPLVRDPGAVPSADFITMPDGILLSILVDDAGPATQTALAAAGLRIESADAAAKVVIGVAPAARIADVTLTDGVRKVEGTRE